MFFVLSDSSLVSVYLGEVCEDCEIDLHKFHRITLPQLPLFHHTVLKVGYNKLIIGYN